MNRIERAVLLNGSAKLQGESTSEPVDADLAATAEGLNAHLRHVPGMPNSTT